MDDAQDSPRILKIVVIGDGGAGKTSLLTAATTGRFPGEYEPTIFDSRQENITVDNIKYTLDLNDTAGGEDYELLRPLQYVGTDVFILCVSCVTQNGIATIESKWLPEMDEYSPGVPFAIVCTKVDLRDDVDLLERVRHEPMSIITPGRLEEIAKHCGASYYHDVSAMHNIGLNTLFPSIIRHCIVNPPKTQKRRQRGSKMALCALS